MRCPFIHIDNEQRNIARDAYLSWNGSRYSMPWQYAGKEVWVGDHRPAVEIHYSTKRIRDLELIRK